MGATPRKAPTLQDVADLAGVSLATASRALKSNQSVTPQTRGRVLDAVAALDYRVLRSPRERQPEAGRFVVLASSIRHLAVAEIVAGVEAASTDAGQAPSFLVTGSDPMREIRALERAATIAGLEAVVVVGGTTPTAIWRESITRAVGTLTRRGVRVVFCGRALVDLDLPDVAIVDYENREGAEAGVSLLLGKGHRRIGLLRGPKGFSTSDERSAGYEQALRAFDVAPDPALIADRAASGPSAVARTADLLARCPDITAIFADNDARAFGALRAAHVQGLRVPQDLSVVGFDDELSASISCPALTTVHTPFTELGRRAALAALGTDPELTPGQRLVLASHVVVRESVAGVPTR